MIGNQQEAHGHQQAHGCEVEELSQEVSDAVRAKWRKQATHWNPALAASLMLRARNVPEADSPSATPRSPFGV